MTEKIDLFTPIVLGPYTLPNRIAMAPMTRNRASAEGVPTDMMARYYAQRASAGLIISEGVIVSPEGFAYPNTPGIFTPAQIQGWKAVTEAVHARGGRIFAQLWHCGRVAHPEVNGGLQPIGPSAIAARGETYTPSGSKPFVTPHAMSLQEIEETVERYAQAARNAKAAGFDGVEIHGANGYLIDQFLRDGSNRRTDAYGGSIANRARFLLEVTEAVLGVWDRGCVGVRLSPLQPFNDMRDSNPEATFSYVVKALGEFKLGYLHITEMGKEAPGVAGPAFDPKLLRPLWPTVYMTNGGYTFETANAAIARGEADMISFGQLFIANPDLVERLRRGAPLNTPDPSTFYTGGEKGYLDYPVLYP